MFTPNPSKAQEPVVLTPGKEFTLHLKVNRITQADNSNVRGNGDTRVVDLNGSRTVLLAKAVRWKASDDVMIEFNRDMDKSGAPIKYFLDNKGEFSVTPEIERVSFSIGQHQRLVKLYLEIA